MFSEHTFGKVNVSAKNITLKRKESDLRDCCTTCFFFLLGGLNDMILNVINMSGDYIFLEEDH